MNTVAFDLETTGLGPQDQITVLGLDVPLGSRVFLNTGHREPRTELESRVSEQVGAPVTLSTHGDESELLRETRAFCRERLAHREVKIASFNGETWNGGFDLPHLRTRLNRADVEWPFESVPYVDIMAVCQTQFNVEADDLVGCYEELIGGELTQLDPFDDSTEAVERWETGEFEPLLLHNIADIRRTTALTRLAERYCSKSDFNMKNLDPVVKTSSGDSC